MTAIEAIVQLRETVNRGNTSDNIDVDIPRAISLLNSAQLKFLKRTIENKNNEDVRRVQTFLETARLKNPSKRNNVVSFNLPENYFEFSNILTKAKKGNCKDSLLLWEVKSENINELLTDINNKPSFYWRESFYSIGGKKVNIYVDDFEIEDVDLIYYRLPKKIDLKGYTNIEGNQSKTQDPEWDDYSIIKVIEIAAKDFNTNTDNLQRFQVDNQRIVNKI